MLPVRSVHPTATLVDTATAGRSTDTDFYLGVKKAFQVLAPATRTHAERRGRLPRPGKALGKARWGADGGYHRRRTGRRDHESTSAATAMRTKPQASGARSAAHRHQPDKAAARHGGGYPRSTERRRRSSVHRGYMLKVCSRKGYWARFRQHQLRSRYRSVRF